jgi:hypothetical protein
LLNFMAASVGEVFYETRLFMDISEGTVNPSSHSFCVAQYGLK